MPMSPLSKTVAQTVGVVVVMGSLAWASVPFYDWFCRVTGFGGTTMTAEAAPEEILDQTIIVRFDASKERGMPWDFKPVERSMEVRIGETGLAFYEAHNPTGGFFSKIACFCFEQQILQPGETVMMPVTFFVDPAIVNDRDGKHVKQITLSYTFYENDLRAEQAALDAAASDADTTLN